jgi:hypothetical protein
MGRYTNIQTKQSTNGKTLRSTTKYPEIPLSFDDIYVYTTVGDRFDTLAQAYYGNASLWWVISIANPQLKQNSYYPPVGTQLRIPTNIGQITSLYNELNNN